MQIYGYFGKLLLQSLKVNASEYFFVWILHHTFCNSGSESVVYLPLLLADFVVF